MASLDLLSRKVRNFYAHVDVNKNQAEMDEVVMIAYTKGEEHVNANLRAKYNMDLNTFPLTAAPIVRMPQAGHPLYSSHPSVVNGQRIVLTTSGNPPMLVTDNGAQKIVYIQQNPAGAYGMAPYGGGPTPFSSSPAYAGSYYDPHNQPRRQNNDFCLCLTALLTCFICFDFD